jgi:hypothetical protein
VAELQTSGLDRVLASLKTIAWLSPGFLAFWPGSVGSTTKAVIATNRNGRHQTQAFPPAATNDAGYQLEQVQRGEEPTDWKPMPSIGPGVNEIRLRLVVQKAA